MFNSARLLLAQSPLSIYRKLPIFIRNNMREASMSTKMAKMTPTIGTHNGTFHCDDVTACYMLKCLDRFKDHDIVRTRDPEQLAAAEIVVDVGGELDIERLRLDHHQRSFNQTIKDYHPNLKTTNPDKPPRLSSAGLVYAVFGKDFLVKKLKLGSTFADIKDDVEKVKMIDALYAKAYVDFMEEIDAVDNGVNMVEGDNIKYNYHIKSSVGHRVARFNPVGEVPDEVRLEQFKKAMEMVGSEISEGVEFLGNIWWPKRQQFRDFVLKRKEFDPSGHIVFIDADYLVGWKSALPDVEEELGIVGEIKYVVYQHQGGSNWRVIGVPVELDAFEIRVPMPEEWRGKRDEELQKVSGVPDAIFVHMSHGFTAGAKSRQGILTMIRKSLGLE